MTDPKADLILHPIRMRILQSLAIRGNRTAKQLLDELGGVPQATLYRHLDKMLKANIIGVAEENKVRGTVEKVYTLSPGGQTVTPSDTTQASAGEHMQLFLRFTASLIGDFGEYVRQPEYDLVQDGVSFRQVHLELSDEEYRSLLQEIRGAMAKYAGNAPGADRRRRMLSTIVIPGTGQEKSTPKEEDKT